MTRSIGRILFALTGAAVGALVVSFAEARVAAQSAGGTARALGLGPLVLAELGVIGPVALALGLGVAAVSLFLEPERPVAPSERVAAIRAAPVLARSRTAALAPLVCGVAVVWLVVTAHVARAALARGAPMASGVGLAVTSIATLVGLSAAALALLPPIRRGLASAASRWPRAIDPVTTGALGVLLALGVVGIGLWMGDPGGEGAGPLAIFGVLGRHELDLRPLVDLVAVAACAWLAPITRAARPLRPASIAVALASIGASFAVTAHEAVALEKDPRAATIVESYAPLGKIALGIVRRATDRDHDGASPYFGGGDCNDRDPSISPLAVDVPGNGIDEDCSGADEGVPAAPSSVASASSAAPIPAVTRDYNLLLITVDTVRAEETGFLGYGKPTTPNLDALAADSAVYERAYAMASYTGKALAPMLIGKFPSETLRDGAHFTRYLAGNTFLAERLRDAGLYTMGAASHWYFREPWGLEQGFDVFDTSAVPSSGQGDTDTSVTSPQLTDAAMRLLAAHGDRRFFLWVHYFDPHAQYVRHEGAPDFVDPARPAGWKMRAAYDGEIWFTDRAIGRLLDYVRSQPWGKDTVIAVTSDHGESMTEHGIQFQHGWEIWEPLVRIPLVLHVPGLPPRRVPQKRGIIDLVPTLLDLMRAPKPPPGQLSGESMVADLFARPGEAYAERDVYIDMPDGPNTHMRRAILHGPTPGMKLIHFGGRQYQLYDLASDPGESDDLSNDPGKLGPMLEALKAKRSTLREIFVKPDAPPAP